MSLTLIPGGGSTPGTRPVRTFEMEYPDAVRDAMGCDTCAGDLLAVQERPDDAVLTLVATHEPTCPIRIKHLETEMTAVDLTLDRLRTADNALAFLNLDIRWDESNQDGGAGDPDVDQVCGLCGAELDGNEGPSAYYGDRPVGRSCAHLVNPTVADAIDFFEREVDFLATDKAFEAEEKLELLALAKRVATRRSTDGRLTVRSVHAAGGFIANYRQTRG